MQSNCVYRTRDYSLRMLAIAGSAPSSHVDVQALAETRQVLAAGVTSCRARRPMIPELEILLRELVCDTDFAAQRVLCRRSMLQDVQHLLRRTRSRALASWLLADIAEL